AVASLAGLQPETPVVLELSSWQLEAMDERKIGPAIAVLTNISPDHLDTYRDFEDYADTKRSIAQHLDATDTLILNADDPEAAKAATITSAQVLWFGHHNDRPGIRIAGNCLISTIPGHPGTLPIPNNPSLQGAHMQSNVAAAATAALVRGAEFAQIGTALEQFGGIPNRTERVATIDGVLFVNDTAATAPVAAIASLRAFAGRPIHLICGGADKQLDMTSLASEIADQSTSVTLLDGTASGTLANLIRHRAPDLPTPIVQSMGEAVSCAAAAAESGDVVLLSPGCASFGLFRDEFDRGQQFREVVLRMQRGETFS
ncbi:MAG TPA: UDP-N-acetylmuramoyl-L-alanine--D-glutamate ligase, partial [Thermomicrobiales bacterium]|nr:UDP-N-acetylmuramoyl-L-alanine--D-glutamate ligase [Thermomicrobiales bacterium]